MRVCAPWWTPAYGKSNGRHPLLGAILEELDPSIELVAVDPARLCTGALERVHAELLELALELADAFRGHPVVSPGDIASFVRTRDLFTQWVVPQDADVLFVHTTPRCTGRLPWVLHVESLTTLFWPFLRHGQLAGVRLRAQPVYWLVRHLLEQPSCRAIFSNLRSTAEMLGAVFESPAIAAKARWIPLGVKLPAADTAAPRRAPDGELVVLFTGSWHQEAASFYARGGVDLLIAFWRAAREHPGLRLILRTALPQGLPRELSEGIAADPRIAWLPQPLCDAELFALYRRADVFAVPGAGLHSLSVARAMHLGAVCIASDAPGFEELICDGETGLLVPGRRERVYSRDPESGWLGDDYSRMRSVDPAYAQRLTEALLRLARSPETLVRLRARAQAHARDQLAFEPFARRITELLREAADPGRGSDRVPARPSPRRAAAAARGARALPEKHPL